MIPLPDLLSMQQLQLKGPLQDLKQVDLPGCIP